jgi:predicted protein tyrosine phosphatase
MKILVVCDQGNNRSVTLAGQLKYLGNDVLSAGIQTNTNATLRMLYDWADRTIVTEESQFRTLAHVVDNEYSIELWDIGPDVYKRPYNKQLLAIVKRLIKEHPEVDCRGT